MNNKGIVFIEDFFKNGNIINKMSFMNFVYIIYKFVNGLWTACNETLIIRILDNVDCYNFLNVLESCPI